MKYQIDIRELLDILNKEKFIVFIGTALFALSFLFGNYYFVEPKYESSVQLVGVPNVTTTNEINANILSITTFKDFAKSTVVLESVINELEDIDISFKALRSSVEVSQSPDSQMFTIQITAGNPEEAEKIADVTAEVFKQKAQEILKNDSIAIVSPAGTDTAKTAPNLKLAAIFGFMIGFVIMVVLVIVKDAFNGTVKSERYIEETFSVISLGSIGKIDKKTKQSISKLDVRHKLRLRRKDIK